MNNWMPFLLTVGCFFGALVATVHASDADPLQDFCVADLSSNAPRVNGYPCKLRSNVTAADFTTSILRQASKLQSFSRKRIISIIRSGMKNWPPITHDLK